MPPLRKLAVAITGIFGAADAGDNPLAYVAGQVQNQVPDGILIVRSPAPDLFRRELSDAHFDTSAELIQCRRGDSYEFRFDHVFLLDTLPKKKTGHKRRWPVPHNSTHMKVTGLDCAICWPLEIGKP